MSDKAKQVLANLIETKRIPETGFFDIDASLIEDYYETYRRLFSKTDKHVKNSNVIFAKKIAFIKLSELLKSRDDIQEIKVKKHKSTSGFIYAITNPSYPNHVKIGMTGDVNVRLNTYQTYDPFRSFKILTYRFFENVRDKEREILKEFSLDLENGEWIKIEAFNELKSKYFQ